MDLGISGRVALVSGASRGLGLAVATRLAAEGAHVAICGRDPDRLGVAAATVDAAGPGRVRHDRVDVCDQAAVTEWVDRVGDDLGGPHIVVSNAGGPPPGTVTEFGLADYRQALETSMLSHVGLVLAALPRIRSSGWGRVLLIGSETIRTPRPRYGLSNTVRPGLVGFCKSLVDELGAGDITVNVLAPGYHQTTALTSQFEDPATGLARVAAGIPVGRIGQPDDFAAVAAFLASAPAGFITGSTLLVDGGAGRGM